MMRGKSLTPEPIIHNRRPADQDSKPLGAAEQTCYL